MPCMTWISFSPLSVRLYSTVGGYRGMDVPPDQAVAIEDVEVLRQHFGTDARQAPLQLGEEHRPICQGQ
jgi:hypothetical protein